MPKHYKKRKSKMSKNGRRIASKLQQLVYQNKMLMKLKRINTSTAFFGVREVNPVDTIGKVELSDRTTAASSQDSLPLVVVPLLNIANGGSQGSGLLRLKQNGYDFTELATVEGLGTIGNADAVTGGSADIKKCIVNYFKCNLLLRQHLSKDAKFKVYLVKILHEDLDPLNITETNSDRQNMKMMFYYNHFLRQQIANPILENMETHLEDIRSKFKILWEKEYHINEQSSDYSEANYKEVKIFRRLDKIINYTESPDANTTLTTNPDTPVHQDSQENTTNSPDTRANLFLIITANASYSDVDHATLYDVMTFDIATRIKYTLPAQDVINV